MTKKETIVRKAKEIYGAVWLHCLSGYPVQTKWESFLSLVAGYFRRNDAVYAEPSEGMWIR